VKWTKLGKIFDPTQHRLPLECQEFAQSPQAIVFDDFVRIYFSTRAKDGDKYLSHVAFVDMDKRLQRVLRVARDPVIALGDFGTFDEHGIFPLNVMRDGAILRGYIGGWSRRVSVSIDGSIGLAFSHDGGVTFDRAGPGPVLTASLNEPFLVGDPFVAKIGGVFHMWYIFGARWIATTSDAKERVYKIAHATSKDGETWARDGIPIIANRLNSDECQALPTVATFRGVHHMFFCYREAIGFRTDRDRAYRIGYASSPDLKTWIRDDSQAGIDVSPEAWDSDMLCYPHVFECDGRAYLLYNGNEFGRFGFGAAVLE
jgi:predicted GH43/DUF377 family glycosyl hydrolase